MPTTLAPGRPGNLTAEQEVKLQQMWAIILDLLGVAHPEENPRQNSVAASTNTGAADANDQAQKKKRFRLPLTGKKARDAADAKQGDGTSNGSTDINEKYGQKQEFLEAISKHTPEQLREIFWTVTKQDNPDAYVLRFLRARKWDTHAAIVMLFSTLRWNIENHVQDNIVRLGEGGWLNKAQSTSGEERKDAADFMTQLRLGKSFVYGTDNDGRPCCIVRVRLHRQGEQSEKSLENFTIHTIETARMMLRPSVDTATLIFDMSSFSLANMDYTPVKFMIKCFEANYPESLGRVVVYKAPWIFQGVWKMIKSWLDPVVASKIHFASDPATLAESVPRSNLMSTMGGDDPYEYHYEEPAEGENSCQIDSETREKLLRERNDLALQYEDATRKWLSESSASNSGASAERSRITGLLAENYWRLDPYVRGRSLYDRLGVIGPHGELDFNKAKSGTQPANGSNGKHN